MRLVLKFALVLVVTVFMAEITLRLTRLTVASKQSKPLGESQTILTVGDSFSFGYGVKRVDSRLSYPATLQDLLSETSGRSPKVINEGRPGNNSGQILESLPSLLEKYKPSTVVVLAGFNNMWNFTGSNYKKIAADGSLLTDVRYYAHHLHFLKLLDYMVRSALGSFLPEPKEDIFSMPQARPYEFLTWETMAANDELNQIRLLKHDFDKMESLIRDFGAVPVFLNYPPFKLPWKLNQTIRKWVKERDVHWVDNYGDFLPLMRKRGYFYLISELDGHHCNSRGYMRMAFNVYQNLADNGLIKVKPMEETAIRDRLNQRRLSILSQRLEQFDDPDCPNSLMCSLAWFDNSENTLDTASLLFELSPTSIWKQIVSHRYLEMAKGGGDFAIGVFTSLLRDEPRKALAVANLMLKADPSARFWKMRRQEASSLLESKMAKPILIE